MLERLWSENPCSSPSVDGGVGAWPSALTADNRVQARTVSKVSLIVSGSKERDNRLTSSILSVSVSNAKMGMLSLTNGRLHAI